MALIRVTSVAVALMAEGLHLHRLNQNAGERGETDSP